MIIRGQQFVLCIVALVLSSAGAKAQSDLEVTNGNRPDRPDTELFRAQEWTFDVSGHWERPQDSVDAFFTDTANDAWGGNLGVNYFFTRNFGLGVNASANDNGGSFVDNVAADVIVRFPIDRLSLAPYILGGAGRVFQPGDLWEAHAGFGVEFRVSPRVGVFADARYLWVEDGMDRSQVRVGFRFAF